MKTVRYHCFETNSSSTHSLTIDAANYPNKQIPKVMTVTCGTFGWEFSKHNDFLTKASYVWTLAMVYNNERLVELMTELSVRHEFDLEWLTDEEKRSLEYHVDHGSEHWEHMVSKKPELNTASGLWEFLISESHWLILGNDNQVHHPNHCNTPKQISNGRFTISAAYITDTKFIHDECSHDLTDPEQIKDLTKNLVDYLIDSNEIEYKAPGDQYGTHYYVTEVYDDHCIAVANDYVGGKWVTLDTITVRVTHYDNKKS